MNNFQRKLNNPLSDISEKRNARRSHINVLEKIHIGILNLMPNKIETEHQFINIFSQVPFNVGLHFLRLESYIPKNCSIEYLRNYYLSIMDIDEDTLDGLIITGAPLENMKFEEVKYWDELTSIIDFSKKYIKSTIYICWGAIAGLYYNYNIPKHNVEEKIFGVFSHEVLDKNNKLMKGFDDDFLVPHSRYFSINEQDIRSKEQKLDILSSSKDSGTLLVANKNLSEIYITGHLEYGAETLKKEYERDIRLGKAIKVPVNYFNNDNINSLPKMKWNAHRTLFFTNWLCECLVRSVNQ
ncbi:homoserine O-succinyltransferase [Proteiniborus sp. DW1]|uniref:homoserine O-succinyltransferase n=1 Tax=Proteiniborus sp. DW1 TaxID=1889883 RepID=UPI00092E011B|nr:homoserine O-succinyltransferase [Proteiniborus sp. DW1]SCG84167.1 homoserine O-succinyltransferase [Proteiniborus sp. DW1]